MSQNPTQYFGLYVNQVLESASWGVWYCSCFVGFGVPFVIYFLFEGGRKYTKIGLTKGVTIGGDASKSDKNTHL